MGLGMDVYNVFVTAHVPMQVKKRKKKFIECIKDADEGTYRSNKIISETYILLLPGIEANIKVLLNHVS